MISNARTFSELQLGEEEIFSHIRTEEVIYCSLGGTLSGNQAESWQDICGESNGETWR